jgi:hypothetical protein
MESLDVQLFIRLDGHEPHGRSRHGFGDSFGVIEIILLGFEIRLDELRCDQSYLMAVSLKGSGEMLRARTGFHADQAGRKICDMAGELAAVELVASDRISRSVATDEVEPRLANVESDGFDVHDDLLP